MKISVEKVKDLKKREGLPGQPLSLFSRLKLFLQGSGFSPFLDHGALLLSHQGNDDQGKNTGRDGDGCRAVESNGSILRQQTVTDPHVRRNQDQAERRS